MIAACAGIVVAGAGVGPSRVPFVTRGAIGARAQGAAARRSAFVALMQFVGLYVASAALHGLLHALDRPLLLAARGARERAFPVVTFVVFEQWFLVPMPKGPLEAWLGY